MADYHDRHAVMMAVVVIDLLCGTAARQHRTGRVHLVEELRGRLGCPGPGRLGVAVPLVQLAEAVAAGVARSVIRTRDIPVEGHRHVEHRCRHSASCLVVATRIAETHASLWLAGYGTGRIGVLNENDNLRIARRARVNGGVDRRSGGPG